MAIFLQALLLLFPVFLLVNSGEFVYMLRILSYDEGTLGMFVAIIFSITPMVTIPALLRKTRPLLIPAAACNLVSLFYGIVHFIAQADLSNAMVLLAVAVPLLIVIAAAVSLVSIAKMLRAFS